MIVGIKSKLPSPSINTEYRAREATIENIIRVAWRAMGAVERRRFLAYVKYVRDHYQDGRGWTKEKGLLHFAEIPEKVSRLMIWAFGWDWGNNPKYLYPFLSRCQMMRINATTRPTCSPDMIGRDNRCPPAPTEERSDTDRRST